MCVDIANKKGNDNLLIGRRKLKNMAYSRKITGKAKEKMLNTTPVPDKRLGRNLDKWLEKKNYSLFEDWGETKFKALDPKENHEHRSIPTIDINKGKFFEYVYGVNQVDQVEKQEIGHAVNVLSVDNDKLIIFDPFYRIMERKSVDYDRLQELKYEDIDGVYKISRNLIENWWNTAQDRRWIWALEPKDANQKTLSLYNEEEAKDYGLRKTERGI